VITLIRNDIGFGGLLASDDLDMKALTGPLHQRAERAIAAGCDLVLHCTGVVSEMAEVTAGAPLLAGPAADRAAAAQAIGQKPPEAFDPVFGEWRWRQLLALIP
jgi:beta-N-acetylhexosaminidase